MTSQLAERHKPTNYSSKSTPPRRKKTRSLWRLRTGVEPDTVQPFGSVERLLAPDYEIQPGDVTATIGAVRQRDAGLSRSRAIFKSSQRKRSGSLLCEPRNPIPPTWRSL